MFRQRSLHMVAATTAVASATAARRYTSAPSTVWITITGDAEHLCGSSSPWTLRVPLEVSSGPAASWNSAGQTGRGVLHRSRTLLAPHTTSSMPGSHPSNNGSATAAAADHNGGESRGPYEVTIDEALLGPETTRGATVLDLVRLLVDPDAGADVEQVSLRDFAAMAPKRQLRAVAGDHECLGVLLGSEVYQSEKDARALRLMGITTVGQWREQPDRVQLSAYGRGVLEMAYASLSRHRQQSQKDLVVAWLTRTIQRAVAEELMAPKQLSAGADNNTAGHLPHHQQLSPSSDAQPSPLWVEAAAGAKARVAEAAAVAAGAAAAPATTTTSPPSDVQTSAKKAKNTLVKEDETKEEEADDDGNAAVTAAVASSPRRGPRQRPVVSSVDKAKVKAAAAAAEETEEIIDEVDAERDEEVDTEMATLMAEAEAILKKDEPSVTRSAAAAAAAPSAATVEDAVPVEAEGEEEEEVEEVVEEVEEEEGEEAEEAKEAESGASTGKKLADAAPAPPAAASPTATTSAAAAARSGSGAPAASSTPSAAAAATVNAQQKEKLARLAELMLKQFNTADGYLHPTNKAERTEQEQRGDILVLDEDTAQVDPLAMFSAYHAATVTEADPVGVRALKTIWTTYNKHQIALEEAADDATAEFYKHESVNALLYGSVLMRALAREEPVVVLEGTALPHYGFPLVSSDTRPFTSAAATSSATDMTPANISPAMHAYKTLFNDKEKRYSPFRPAIDQNAGCSVVRLSGTTLHLYYTSTKDHVMEEEVRLPFAEVMLGMLHLLRQKVLPRVNVVHYHLIATKLADASADLNFMLRSTATLDLTNPFTKEEHARLKALAAPLGMSEEMDEFRCIDDLVMEIEDNSGASVVHSLLHNREDLEATLTATLAQLLPEDVEVDAAAKDTAHNTEADEAVEEEEEVAPSPPSAPPVAASSRKGKSAAAAAAAAASAPTPSRAGVAAARRPAPAADAEDDEAVEEAGEEEEEEDVEVLADEEGDLEAEDDEEEVVAPLHATRAKAHNTKKPMHHHHPAPPVAPTARRPAATPIKENVGDEEAELEEAIYTQWQKQKEQQQPQHRTAGSHKTTAAAKATAPSRGVAKPEMDDEEYAEEEELAEEEEEEEEVVAAKPAARAAASSPTRRNGAAHTRGLAPAPAAPLPAAVAGAGDEEEEEEFEEEEEEVEEVDEEDDDEMEVVTAPQLPRRPAGHRAVPVAVEEADADEEEEAEEDEEEDEVEAPRRPSPPVQAHHRSTRHPSAAPTAAGAVPRARGPPPPAAAPSQPAEEVEEAVDEESVPPPLPQVRTRRGAARRHSARSRPSALEDEQQSTSAGHEEDGSADAGEAVVADEDQWFRKKPKRRYFE